MGQIQWTFQKNDEYMTPPYAVYPIMERLEPGTVIWCPFDRADSAFVRVFTAHGFQVVYGHIEDGQDFFRMRVPECDYIISNPPYSMKSEVIRHLYQIGKPFAMLLNFQGIFDSRERFQMFEENRVEMLWLSPRVNYLDKNGHETVRAPFQSGYLCSGICREKLEFARIDIKQGMADAGRREHGKNRTD